MTVVRGLRRPPFLHTYDSKNRVLPQTILSSYPLAKRSVCKATFNDPVTQ